MTQSASASLTFNVSPTVDATQSLALDANVVGSIATPGQVQSYTFNSGVGNETGF